ncbi:mechanosensitive channel protein, partial [Cronobacter sakazakii]
MPWILLLLVSLFSVSANAVSLPAAVVGASTTQKSETPPAEPDADKKKAAYAALADVLENEASRKALIEQLRQAAATPADQPTPVIKPPVN